MKKPVSNNGVFSGGLRWLKRHHMLLALLLSTLHLGLAYTHVRDSGRTDHMFPEGSQGVSGIFDGMGVKTCRPIIDDVENMT